MYAQICVVESIAYTSFSTRNCLASLGEKKLWRVCVRNHGVRITGRSFHSVCGRFLFILFSCREKICTSVEIRKHICIVKTNKFNFPPNLTNLTLDINHYNIVKWNYNGQPHNICLSHTLYRYSSSHNICSVGHSSFGKYLYHLHLRFVFCVVLDTIYLLSGRLCWVQISWWATWSSSVEVEL